MGLSLILTGAKCEADTDKETCTIYWMKRSEWVDCWLLKWRNNVSVCLCCTFFLGRKHSLKQQQLCSLMTEMRGGERERENGKIGWIKRKYIWEVEIISHLSHLDQGISYMHEITTELILTSLIHNFLPLLFFFEREMGTQSLLAIIFL